MSQISASTLNSNPRLGFHYFPDTLHYREVDLQTWLPALQDLGASWLVMRSETGRAIPEYFFQALKQAQIEPLIQFPLALDQMPNLKELETLLDVYARWGARYALLFDRPNTREAWSSTAWMQEDLVERFLDRFVPAANLAMQAGMAPVFPALQPGGSYWDTAFLRSALQGMQRRKQDLLLQSLVLSANGWSPAQRSLDWGAGGPERWPQVRPYHTPAGSQDQRGFRIFDWYLATARSVLQEPCPIIMLQAGLPDDPRVIDGAAAWSQESAQNYEIITRLLDGENVTDPTCAENLLEPVPAEVMACTFWLLSADSNRPHAAQAWFRADGKAHPAIDKLRALRRQRQEHAASLAEQNKAAASAHKLDEHPIQHYLLLPSFDWGISDWYLEVIRPYVKKHRPTIGFSPDEAVKAERVVVIGSLSSYPEEMMSRFERAGCMIEQISGDGTFIATELAER